MSLRRKLLLSITLVLVASLMAGGLLTYWQSVRRLEVEMSSALAVGGATLRNAVATHQNLSDTGLVTSSIVALFDGDRHIEARLNRVDGTVIAQSRRAKPAVPPPAWLAKLLLGTPETRSLMVPGDNGQPRQIILEASATNELSEIWEEIRLKVLIVTGLAAIVFGVVSVILHSALKPLENLSAALGRIGEGAFGTQVPVGGPSELAAIYTQFNRMSAALSDLESQNAALKAQIESVQEEERAEIARDLHDEIGPFLFATDADAQTIPSLLARRDDGAVSATAARIRQSVNHMQTHLRAILGRLKPANMIDLGLSHATENLVAFWQSRRPDVTFDVSLSGERFPPAVEEIAFRIFQEGASNAVRHGRPSRIALAAKPTAHNTLRVCVADDGVGLATPKSGGFGLAGMRERVEAIGGTFAISAGNPGPGVQLTADLPLTRSGKFTRGARIVETTHS